MKGLSTGKPLEKMGMYPPTGEVFLEDVEVERDHLLGGREREPAHGQVIDVFKGERTGVAQMCLGIIERVSTRCVMRRSAARGGQPIAGYQLVQEKLARMMVAYVNVKNIVSQAAPRRKARHARFARRSERTKLY